MLDAYAHDPIPNAIPIKAMSIARVISRTPSARLKFLSFTTTSGMNCRVLSAIRAAFAMMRPWPQFLAYLNTLVLIERDALVSRACTYGACQNFHNGIPICPAFGF